MPLYLISVFQIVEWTASCTCFFIRKRVIHIWTRTNGYKDRFTWTDRHGLFPEIKQKPNKCLTLPPSEGIDRKSLADFPPFPWQELSRGPQIPGSLYLMVITETLRMIQPLNKKKSLETKRNHHVLWGGFGCVIFVTLSCWLKKKEKNKKTLKLCHIIIRFLSSFFHFPKYS